MWSVECGTQYPVRWYDIIFELSSACETPLRHESGRYRLNIHSSHFLNRRNGEEVVVYFAVVPRMGLCAPEQGQPSIGDDQNAS